MTLRHGSHRTVLVELCVYVWCITTRFLFSVWFFWVRPRQVPAVGDDILLRSATSLAADIRTGKVKSVQLISAYIERIRLVQPIINAVVEEIFEEALRDADAADKLVASGSMTIQEMSQQKPLLGLPITIKNSIATKGLRQDAGSLLRLGHRAKEDAPSVALIRAAGAIPLALTNVPELCLWGDAKNCIDGATRNPYDWRRNPGGSSGGEGSLIASAGSLMGLGTDIAGSVRLPAAYCGIFSHKPTSGTVPNGGLVPDVGDAMRQYNCVGPMTRFSEDLPLLLNILAGSNTNQLRLNKKVNLKDIKVYFSKTEGCQYFSRVTPEAQQAVCNVTQHMKEAHNITAEELTLPELQNAVITWLKVRAAKDPNPLDQLFRPGGLNTFLELLRILIRTGRHTIAVLVTAKVAEWFRFSSKAKAASFVKTVEALRDRFEETLGDNGVFVLPAATSVAGFQNQDVLMCDSLSMTALFSLFQVPVTVCPVLMHSSKDGGRLPLAVQIVAKRGNDRLCLAVASEIEKKFGGWHDPGARHKD
ncbi:fatty-acid amide hydrolase 2-A-like [Haemaphysalis longicornis]